MADIRHRVGIQAAPGDVYEKLSTTAGVASWWTHDVVGDAAKGGRIEVYFGSLRLDAVDSVNSTTLRVTAPSVQLLQIDDALARLKSIPIRVIVKTPGGVSRANPFSRFTYL